MDSKIVYVDIYYSLFEEDGMNIRELLHLDSIDIRTNVDIGEVISDLKQLIFKKYGDGLYIKAEEFEEICYLNIIIMFGKEYEFLVEYLDTINDPNDKLVDHLSNEDHRYFVSVDYFFNQRETEELKKILDELGVESKVYFIERQAFERGAGDYHENVILSFLSGSVEAIGNRLTHILMDRLSRHQNPRIVKFNIDKVITYISEETGINKQDLHVSKIEHNQNSITEIEIINRYKKIKVQYDQNTKAISYEIDDKTQTMI